MAIPSFKPLVLALVVAAVVLANLAIVGRHRLFAKLSPCDCSASVDRTVYPGEKEKLSEMDDLARRLGRIEAYCKKYAGILQAESSVDHSANVSSSMCARDPRSLYLVDTRRFAFCSIPKAATSSIKALVLLAENVSAVATDADGIYKAFRRRFRVLCPSAYVRDHLVTNYTKAIIVRHPFERLVSAYVNKIRTARPKITGARRMYKSGFRGSGPNGTFTFAEFVNIILNTSAVTWDPHWAPYTRRCRPCTMRYDIILKVESLDRDLASLLPRIGLAGWSFPKKNTKTVAEESDADSAHYFAELTRQQVLLLHAIYMYDFELFGYTLSGYATPVH
ncbi:carbohydrate sulfotransferase 9-like [Dermacentor andersoni]|uniref:carbohydrate sulfotransferase 9-like n=1 Tax=Dermacentor andersoni TaxID=34620 RepID=UPI0021550C51|nr:carbohydrate sulfotransferase 9-like [Dermacentor andersoni]